VCASLSPAAAAGALGRFGLVGRSELNFAGVAGLTAAGECLFFAFLPSVTTPLVMLCESQSNSTAGLQSPNYIPF
jgi:hypothetical protein